METDRPAGLLTTEEIDGGFALTAALPCPAAEARCLAMVCACWVREAVGGDAKIAWPNRVLLDGRRVCAVECRATADGGVRFTFRPDPAVLPLAPAPFRTAVARAASEALRGYPENRPALLAAYCEHCVTVMRFVNVTYRGVPLYGFAFAVDRHGGLMVMTQESHTVVTVYGGEAVPVKKEDAPDAVPEVPPMPGRG